MKTENGVKKVDYKILSVKRCKDCGKHLKKNSEIKGHSLCYVCFKVSKGKKTMNKYGFINGQKVIIETIDLIKLQKQNRRTWAA